MPKTLFCNGFEVGHNAEVFCLIFRFQSPNGSIVETAYVVISPSGAKTLEGQLSAEMKDYEQEHGTVEPWKSGVNPNSNAQGENTKYRV